MMLPLLLSLVVSVTDDPPVKVWLNHDNYFQRGDNARVNVRLADDGYLLVLRADAEGRVRVLFPLDPSNDNFARGHETIEVRGRATAKRSSWTTARARGWCSPPGPARRSSSTSSCAAIIGTTACSTRARRATTRKPRWSTWCSA